MSKKDNTEKSERREKNCTRTLTHIHFYTLHFSLSILSLFFLLLLFFFFLLFFVDFPKHFSQRFFTFNFWKHLKLTEQQSGDFFDFSLTQFSNIFQLCSLGKLLWFSDFFYHFTFHYTTSFLLNGKAMRKSSISKTLIQFSSFLYQCFSMYFPWRWEQRWHSFSICKFLLCKLHTLRCGM